MRTPPPLHLNLFHRPASQPPPPTALGISVRAEPPPYPNLLQRDAPDPPSPTPRARPAPAWTPLYSCLFLLFLLLSSAACTDGPAAEGPEPLAVGSVLGAGGEAAEGYARALGPRPFDFPADHGPHPDFQSEWWYFVGNLRSTGDSGSDEGDGEPRRFGFQLTFFRFAVAPPTLEPDPEERPSDWASRQVWMAHLALTDVRGRRFHAFERFRRGALGLAGAAFGSAGQTGPEDPGAGAFRVWLDDWRAEARQPGTLFPLDLVAGEEGVRLDLELAALKPRVLQGEQGWSPKGPEPGNASYYYSYPRLRVSGEVAVDGEVHPVAGTAWLDREWSTSALGADEVGWDWFSLQFQAPGGEAPGEGDGEPRELMLYRIRRADGSAAPTSAATLVTADGSARSVDWAEAEVEVLGRWTSPDSGAVYPSGWRFRLPGEDLALEVRPVLSDQELDVAFRYWEGAVDVAGTHRGEPVEGVGYVELTGY